MPRRRQIPAYTLHKPTGQARVRLGGKDHYLGAYGSEASRRKYDELIRQWLDGMAAPVSGVQAPAPGLTVADVLALYDQHAEGRYRKCGRATGQLERVRIAFGPVRLRHGPTAAVAFGPRALKECRRDMVALGWTRGFVNCCTACVVRAWGWATSEELLPRDAAFALREVAPLARGEEGVREGRKITAAPPAAVDGALARLQPAVRDLLAVQRLAGMRPVEACHLRGQGIDRAGRVPDGRQFAGVWVYLVPEEANKTAHHGRQRVVFLGPLAQAILLPYLERRGPDEYLFSPARSRQEWHAARTATRKTKLWPSHVANNVRRRKRKPKRAAGCRYNTRAVQHAVARACKAAGVPHWAPNALRHLRATEIRARFSPDHARVVLGHSLPGVTGTYAEADLEKAALVMRRIG
jgi:integrase